MAACSSTSARPSVTSGRISWARWPENRYAGTPGGRIDMYDGYTFVDVPVRYADEVLKAMGHARIKAESEHPCVEKANGRR